MKKENLMDLPVYNGLLLEKKIIPKKDSEGNFYQFILGFIGFNLTYEVKESIFDQYNEKDLVKVLVTPEAKAKDNYCYFEPVISGIKKAEKLEDILKIPVGRLYVTNAEVIKMQDSKDKEKSIEYSKLSLAGALNGAFTGNKDFINGIEKNTTYECLMTIGIKKGVVQFLPSGFKKIEGVGIDF